MPLSPNINDRERDKFDLNSNDETCVRTCGESEVKNILIDVPHDSIVASYPNATTEVFEYKTGGVLGTVVATVTVTYLSASKKEISSVIKTPTV